MTFDYFDENGLQSFVDYLRDVKMYVNSTIRKDVVMFNTLTIKGPATEEAIRSSVEGIGYTFKGKVEKGAGKQGERRHVTGRETASR